MTKGITLLGKRHTCISKFCYRVTGNKHITSLLLIISIVILHQICLFCSKLLQQKCSSCADNFTTIILEYEDYKQNLNLFILKSGEKVFTCYFFFLIKYLEL